MRKKPHHYRYKNLTILGLGLVLAFFLYQYEPFHALLLSVGEWGYVGAFLAGVLFVSSFTLATSIVVLLILAEQLHILELAVLAGIGAVLGDFFIFHFVKDGLVTEIKPLFTKFGGRHLLTLLHTPYFSWTLPLVGALIIASPLPDELGISLIGLSKINTVGFMMLSFVANSMGVLAVVFASTLLKP